MLRELEEAVQRKFNVAADGAHTMSVTESHVDWESRLHISQVWDSYGCKIIGIICNFFGFVYQALKYYGVSLYAYIALTGLQVTGCDQAHVRQKLDWVALRQLISGRKCFLCNSKWQIFCLCQ